MIQNDNETFPFCIESRACEVVFINKTYIWGFVHFRLHWAALGASLESVFDSVCPGKHPLCVPILFHPRGLFDRVEFQAHKGSLFFRLGAQPTAHRSSKWSAKLDPARTEGGTFGVYGGFILMPLRLFPFLR